MAGSPFATLGSRRRLLQAGGTGGTGLVGAIQGRVAEVSMWRTPLTKQQVNSPAQSVNSPCQSVNSQPQS
eukprot:8164129-Pyramimonas_sp.AAC.1